MIIPVHPDDAEAFLDSREPTTDVVVDRRTLGRHRPTRRTLGRNRPTRRTLGRRSP